MDKIIDLSCKLLLNRHIVGSSILLVVLFTLVVDVMGLVHPCPYCRTQRLALGVLAIIMMLKAYHVLLARYIAAVIGMTGLVVGIMQNFNHIKKINKGEFDWAGLWIGHPWILSGLAVMALTWQLLLIFDADKQSPRRG
ncbi:disulfide bond formation protein B [Sphingomonas sp. SCN 67-18]|uniref:disulfide bond formation protein B n=1 Tax=uncultured Sphingomonas sp. TaxID=158754 RepID=UPI0025F0040C|nr:disulfide bond formation protein B [Sphingomonas sp. SCN 67-18]